MNNGEWKTIEKSKKNKNNNVIENKDGKCRINSCNKKVLFKYILCFKHYFEYYPNPEYKKKAYKILTECQGGCGKLKDECTCTETDLFKGCHFKGWNNYIEKMGYNK
jgi:hypothetical protein